MHLFKNKNLYKTLKLIYWKIKTPNLISCGNYHNLVSEKQIRIQMSQSTSTGLVLKQTIAHPGSFFSDLFHSFLSIIDIHSKLEFIIFSIADKKGKGSSLMKTEQELCLRTLPNGIQSLSLCRCLKIHYFLYSSHVAERKITTLLDCHDFSSLAVMSCVSTF